MSRLRGSVPGSVATGGGVSGAPGADSRRSAGNDSRTGLSFRAGPTCAGQPAGTACWMALADRPGCSVWNPGLQPGATVTWTAACADGLAEGTGTLTWTVSEGTQTATGRIQGGRRTGHWILRFASGNVAEGPFVEGEQNGHWVFRTPDGIVTEGPEVDGKPHGEWVVRRPDGRVEVQRWENGERVDR